MYIVVIYLIHINLNEVFYIFMLELRITIASVSNVNVQLLSPNCSIRAYSLKSYMQIKCAILEQILCFLYISIALALALSNGSLIVDGIDYSIISCYTRWSQSKRVN